MPSRFMIWLGQRWCALLGGHHHLAIFDSQTPEWYLQCMSCGYRTQGWRLEDQPRFKQTYAAKNLSHL